MTSSVWLQRGRNAGRSTVGSGVFDRAERPGMTPGLPRPYLAPVIAGAVARTPARCPPTPVAAMPSRGSAALAVLGRSIFRVR